MPSPVPAGYTRGPILFIGASSTHASAESLLQRFWNEAGAYGSRLVVIAVGKAGARAGAQAAACFEAWESEATDLIVLEKRSDAMALDGNQRMTAATGVLLAGDDALQMAGVLGGTPPAQTLRRMNAQSKVVCALGSGGSILCQHMLNGAPAAGEHPLLHRDLVQFAPGMGLLNRMVIDLPPSGTTAALSLPRLLAAVGLNPFLVGVGLEQDTGVVVYPNAVMEVFGSRSVLVVDGAHVGHADLFSGDAAHAASLLGATVHVLAAGCTFNFDTHAAMAALESDADAPRREVVRKSAY